MITPGDLAKLNGFENEIQFRQPLFLNEAFETLLEIALKHYPLLRVMNSGSISRFEELLSEKIAEIEIEICSLTGQPIEQP